MNANAANHFAYIQQVVGRRLVRAGETYKRPLDDDDEDEDLRQPGTVKKKN